MGECTFDGPFGAVGCSIDSTKSNFKDLKFLDALDNELSDGTLIAATIVLKSNKESLDLIAELIEQQVPFTFNYTKDNSIEICYKND